jgi:hypothetical protein
VKFWVVVFILFVTGSGMPAWAEDESLGATVGFSLNDATVGDPASGSSRPGRPMTR